MRAVAALPALALLMASCTSTPPPGPSPTASMLRVLVGGTRDGSLVARAVTLGAAGARVELLSRPDRHGSSAVAELVGLHAADATWLAAVSAEILAGEVLEDTAPRVAEMTPVARLPSEPFVLAVAPASPITDARDLRRRLERDASTVRFAGGPQASPGHLLAAAVVRDAAKRASALVYAAHATPQEAIAAVAGGQSQVAVAPYGVARAALADGRLRGLAISSGARVDAVALPTLRESGIDVTFTDWALLVAPPGIIAPELRARRDDVTRAHAQPAWAEAVRRNGWIDDFATQGLVTFLGTELTRTVALLRDLALVR